MAPDILPVALRAARLAAEACLAVLAESPDAPDAMAKAGKEPVTVADYASQALILREIAAAFPDHRVVAEEGSQHMADQAGEEGGRRIAGVVGRVIGRATDLDEVAGWIDHDGPPGSPYTWVVDPIDGTKGFLRREQFAVAIGLLRDGRVHAGVLACPHLVGGPGAGRGVLFGAGPGTGAFVEPLRGGDRAPVRVSTTSDAEAVRVLGSVESAHGDPALVSAVMEEAGLGGGMVRLDSQVKYAAVASGMAEIYLRPRSRPDYRENVWDHAAGVAVVTAAGGRVTDLDGRDLDFSIGPKLSENRGVLATNGLVHGPVLEALRRIEGS